MIFSLSFAFLVSCSEPPPKINPPANSKSLDDSAAAYNHQILKTEIQDIDDFILRYQWEMTKTQTGLHYLIYKQGSGPKVVAGDIVSIKYKVNLLNGDLVFKSDPGKLLTFEVGKGSVTNGLEEGIMLMKKDSRAKLIVPSHLAFGLLGDLEKIPARAALVYDVELCAIKQSKK